MRRGCCGSAAVAAVNFGAAAVGLAAKQSAFTGAETGNYARRKKEQGKHQCYDNFTHGSDISLLGILLSLFGKARRCFVSVEITLLLDSSYKGNMGIPHW
jgi:hypothetical protein